MKTLLYVAALLGLFTLPQCTKNDPLVPADSSAGSNFPTQVGDYWVYKVTNYQQNTVDTVKVSVAGTIKNPKGPDTLAILQFKGSKTADTQYVSVIGDTVRFYYQIGGQAIANAFIFPLVLNKSYSLNSYASFADLINYSILSSFNSEIKQDSNTKKVIVYKVEKRFLTPYANPIREFYVIIDDFAPAFGIIKETREYLVGPAGKEKTYVTETWELLSLHLNVQNHSTL